MSSTFQLYRFAVIEAKNITRARLEAEFRDGIASASALEKAIERQLTTGQSCTPWRVTEAEQRGSRDGVRMAALEFYWEHRHDLQQVMNSTPHRKETLSEPQAGTKEGVALMSKGTPQEALLQELARFFRRFKPGGDLAPIDDRDEWEKLIRSNPPPEEQELVNELARFADLWRYFQDRNEKLGPEIVKALGEVHKLPVALRAARVREINQELMKRIGEFDLGTPQ
jgi:hypothetical protein